MLYRALAILDAVAAVVATLHLLLRYRRATAAIAWLFAIWVLPILGAFLYAVLAVYEHPRKLRRRRERIAALRGPERKGTLHPARYPPGRLAGSKLANIMDRIAPFPLAAGHRVEVLPGGDAAFEAMLEAAREARQEILLESYIFEEGAITRNLREVLAERVRAGVSVRILYDHLGSLQTSARFLESFRAAGVRVAGFLKPNPFKGRFQINFRNHRKVLVTDGRVAFTGGQNWSDLYSETHARGRAGIRDLHVRLQGPAAAAMRRVFLEDWAVAVEEEVDASPLVLPPPAGDCFARVLPHGPDEEFEGLVAVFLAALQQARHNVLCVTPFFIPGGTFLEALRLAALGGARVRILLPKRSDHITADLASRRYFGPLLDAGAEIWLHQGPFLHAKALVIDSCWSSVGSTNFDARSFYCNYELNLEVPGEEFAAAVLRYFEPDFAKSERVHRIPFHHRPLIRKVLQNAAALVEPLL